MTIGSQLDDLLQMYTKRMNEQSIRINDLTRVIDIFGKGLTALTAKDRDLELRIARLELLLDTPPTPIEDSFFDPNSFDGFS